ncbi:FecCD family ABC transporter permease [Nonomuraea sp. SYSU D8015]|uniref:FecCD family ABC transporter permease n=1 Tax=Nonomuraea sp. SYSU D8015 TaxID=2593644 RepID=UPI001CB70C96|nr:iron chelate uptake ABC transporter family permease subunit [Nonomuraea sp. SYSU D8015]
MTPTTPPTPPAPPTPPTPSTPPPAPASLATTGTTPPITPPTGPAGRAAPTTPAATPPATPPAGAPAAMPTAGAFRATRRRRTTRLIAVTCALTATVTALFVLTMMAGSFQLTPGEVITSVLHLRHEPSVDFVVRDLRLPTATSALAVGLALGASGTIFQQLLRNPLASPDFVGITSGAGLAAITGIVLLQAGGLAISALALGGALTAALLMYLLAWRDGLAGYRFILIGIGIALFFDGLIGYMLTRAQLSEARQAMHWLTGSIGQAGPAVLLVALAVAVAGPIIFVALVAGPIANRLLGPATGAIIAAALTGATLLLTADLIANHLLPTPLPTGVVTGAVGAPCLLWLLATANRQGAGG